MLGQEAARVNAVQRVDAGLVVAAAEWAAEWAAVTAA
jgi:hypothetical protein